MAKTIFIGERVKVKVAKVTREFSLMQATALVLGNFDGVHRGHQKLIKEATAWAREHGVNSAVLTFAPHPLQVLQPAKAPELLSNNTLKRQYIEKLEPDFLLEVPFTERLAQMSPEEFVSRILMDKLRAAAIFVGYNYTFGAGGKGTPELLQQLQQTYNYYLQVIPPVTINGEVVSSSLIRKYLQQGEIELANRYLGHPYTLQGQVIAGDQRGRQIGFPTANLRLIDQKVMVPTGVYAVWVRGEGFYKAGVMNVGCCPTFGKQTLSVEVHLIDYQGDLYGMTLQVEIVKRLRDEKTFSGVDQLVAQIREDVAAATEILYSG